MARKSAVYGNESISSLKGADRVRKRPAVIFGSDGLDGCQHAVFEIISNSIDEAREGFGNKIIVTRYSDHSIEVQDYGRGLPVDYNNKEKRYGNYADNFPLCLRDFSFLHRRVIHENHRLQVQRYGSFQPAYLLRRI